MVRSSRYVLLVCAACFVACGGERAPEPVKLAITTPATSEAIVPFDLAVLRGHAAPSEVLKLRVTRGEETYAFEVEAGTTLALALDPERATARVPVALPGLATLPSASAVVAEVRRRLTALDPDAEVREGLDDDAFLVDLPASGEGDALARTLGAVTEGRDLRFLIEVLPKELYRSPHDGKTPPRLEAEPHPWPDTLEAYQRFKAAEVGRWRQAEDAGLPYTPSREGFLVLPQHGSEAASETDFRVFEWPADAAYRFDGRMLRNAFVGQDPYTGRPMVLYDVAAEQQDAFEAWTGANVGLPMAIVLDWEVRSAPVIHSPLLDNVQITLGRGSYSELRAEAEALAGSLQQRSGALPVAFVASLTRWDDGTFEALVPLAEDDAVTLTVEVGGARAVQDIRRQPLVDVAEPYATDAVLGAMMLGRLDAEAGAVRLRGLGAEVVQRLAGILAADPSLARRAHAAALLGRTDPESADAVEALIAALRHPAPELRRAVAQAVAHLAPSPALTPAILGAMNSLDPVDQVPFIEALGRVGQVAEGPLAVLLRLAAHGDADAAMAARRVLSSPRWAESPLLRAAAESEDPAVRAAAVHSVAMASDAADTDLGWLVGRTKDEDAGVRMAAVSGLLASVWGGSDAKDRLLSHLDALLLLLEDPETAVRQNVAQVLGELGGETPARLLLLVEHERPEVRQAALLALQTSEGLRADALSVLRNALGDSDIHTRLAAVSPYLRHGGKAEDALVVIEEGLAEPHPESAAPQTALGLLLIQGLEPTQYGGVLALLDDPREAVRGLAALVLVRDGKADERATRMVEAIRREPSHPLHGLSQRGR